MRELTHRPGRFAAYVRRQMNNCESSVVHLFVHLWCLQLLAVFLPVPTQSRTRWAFFQGYFWLPCPICGEWSSGLDWKLQPGHEFSVPTAACRGEGIRAWAAHGTCRGEGICPACTLDGVGDRAWAAHRTKA